MDKRAQKKLVEQYNSIEIEMVFCPYIFLDIFTLPQAIDEARRASMLCADERSQNDLFQGYKLAIISALHLYVDNVIRHPSIIDVKVDPNFYDYWAFSQDRGKDKLKAVVRSNHAVSALIARVQSLFTAVLKTESFNELPACLGLLQDFSASLRRLFVNYYASFEKIGNRWVSVDLEQTLYRRAPDILWTQLMNFKTLRGVYREAYLNHRPERLNIIDHSDLFNDSVMTEAHQEPFESFGISPLPDRWVPGYSLVMCESLRTLISPQLLSDLSELLEHGKTMQNWLDFNKFSLKLRESLSIIPNWFQPGSKLLFKKKKQIPARERRTLMLPVPRGTNIEQVRGMLGNAARIVEVESPSALPNFKCVLDGAVVGAKRTGGKVQVAEIRHPVSRGQYDYSFAIFMPAYAGLLPINNSKWWVFFDICNDFSGGASNVLRQIRDSIQKQRKNIEVLKIKVPKEEFADLCAAPGFRYLRNEIDKMKGLDSETRGVFPELLLVTYLAAEGAHPIKPRFRPRFLKGKELDVVGINWDGGSPSQVTIFESKGRAIHSNEDLQKKINEFGNKIEIVKKNLKELVKELEIPYKKDVKLETVFVSMHDLKQFVFEIPSGITIWDFGRFQEELERVGISPDYRNLLKRKILARVVSFDESFLDNFFGGGKLGLEC